MTTADRLSTWLMLLLSFGTGILDAATYLGLDQVFTANMTGNVVFVGLGIAGGDGVPLLRAALALGGFALGAYVIGLVQRGRHPRPNADPVAVGTFLFAALLTGGSAIGLSVLDLDVVTLDSLTVVLAFAMGGQAVAARRVAVTDVSTVVVTSTLAGLAADNPLSGNRTDWLSTLRRFSAVLAMGLGAVVGAFLLRLGLPVPVGVAAGVMLLVGLVSLARVVRDRRTRAEREPVAVS